MAAYCFTALREGSWAVFGILGGLIGAVPALVYSVGWAQVEWADDFGVFDFIASHRLLSESDWARPFALALVGVALVGAARRRSSETGSA